MNREQTTRTTPLADEVVLTPDLAKAALITIDTQQDVLDGQPSEIPGTTDILPAMRDLLTAFRRFGRPIIHIVRLYLEDGSNVDLCRRAAVRNGARTFIAGSRGAELAPGLAPDAGVTLRPETLLAGSPQVLGPNEVAIYKPRWGAFYKTPLEDHLRENDVSTLVFCGCNFPNCPRTSIYEASERDFRLLVAADALSRLDRTGIEDLRGIGTYVWSAAEIIEDLGQQISSGIERNPDSVASG